MLVDRLAEQVSKDRLAETFLDVLINFGAGDLIGFVRATNG